MLRVFFSSEQLGVSIRTKALIFGMIPIVHLFMLGLIIKTVAKTYNAALKKLGDHNPDFLSAVGNLTASFCKEYNEQFPDVSLILYTGSNKFHFSL